LAVRPESTGRNVDQFPWVRCALSGGTPMTLVVESQGVRREIVATHPLRSPFE
jgi:hypothetical protein